MIALNTVNKLTLISAIKQLEPLPQLSSSLWGVVPDPDGILISILT